MIRGALTLFFRGYVIVLLTAMNVYMVSHGRYLGSFLTSLTISLVWWGNTRQTTIAFRGASVFYGLGAGCGTMTGMLLMKWVYG